MISLIISVDGLVVYMFWGYTREKIESICFQSYTRETIKHNHQIPRNIGQIGHCEQNLSFSFTSTLDKLKENKILFLQKFDVFFGFVYLFVIYKPQSV